MSTEELKSVPLSQESTSTQNQQGMRAVSSTPAVGFADHFFAAMVQDGLVYPPGTLQPQVVLFTRKLCCSKQEVKGFLAALFLRLQFISNWSTYFQDL